MGDNFQLPLTKRGAQFKSIITPYLTLSSKKSKPIMVIRILQLFKILFWINYKLAQHLLRNLTKERKIISSIVEKLGNHSLLEIGCGTG